MEAGSVDRRPWLGPLLLVGGWLAEGERAQGELGNISHQRQGQLGGWGGGVTVHFPCRLGVGVRASEICTPTQEEI